MSPRKILVGVWELAKQTRIAKPGPTKAQRSNDVCWLKSPAPPAVAKQITTSGVIVARLGQACIVKICQCNVQRVSAGLVSHI